MTNGTVRVSFLVPIAQADDAGAVDIAISRALEQAYLRAQTDEQGLIQSFLSDCSWKEVK